jgi:hypothetical protein
MNAKPSTKKATRKPKAATTGDLPELKAGMLVAYGQVEGRLPVGLVIELTETPGVVRLVAETPQERRKRLAETRRLTLKAFQLSYENHQKNLRQKKTA